MAADTSTLYAKISTIQFSDFTPSRITRPSSNHLLQEHDPVADLCSASVARGNRERSHSAMVCSNIPLKGRYVDVEITQSFPGGIPIVSIAEEELIAGRGHSLSDPTAGCTINPLCIRSRNESKRTAIRRKRTEKMDAPSFIVLESCNENNGTEIASSPKRIPDAKAIRPAPLGIPAANKIRIKKRHFSPPRSPPPPPPPPVVESGFHREDKNSREVEHGVPAVTSVVDEGGYVTVHRLDTSDYTDSARIGDKSRNEDESLTSPGNARSAYSSGSSSPIPCSYIVRTENGRIAITEDDSQHYSDAEDQAPVPSVFQKAHKPLTKHSPSSLLSSSAPSSRVPLTMPSIPSPLLQDGGSPPRIGRTKPVPPPRRKTLLQLQETNIQYHSDSRVLKSAKSSPDLHAPAQRARSVSFLQCKVGEDCGQYPADYLSCKEVDCYIECVDHVAKHLVDSRPVEVVAYVTSEKVRLAPPKNAALLFKSFAMKDILSVQKCSKNKRIIGIVVWKPKSLPACHILRCPDHLVANSLYEATWYQSQSVDDVALKSKVRLGSGNSFE